jgi:3-demethoxyubiquinol 3-hydroxylase
MATSNGLPTMTQRHFNLIDRLLIDSQNALGTVFGSARSQRPNPADDQPDLVLDDEQRRHAAGLMRVNHVGEVCAQALYVGQAAVARDEETRQQLLAAAQEETDHLAWCADRLQELDSRPSLLNPLWYAGSYAIGLLAGLRGDGWNLGFVVETERQVEAHLDAHLQTLPEADARSRAILTTMKADEARHADHAQALGARALPQPVPVLMAGASKLMKTIAYRI